MYINANTNIVANRIPIGLDNSFIRRVLRGLIYGLI